MIRNFITILNITILCIIFTNNTYGKEVLLPKPTGLYDVGTKAIEFKDDTRTMLRDKNIRHWMVQAFYPSANHEGTYPYMPGTLKKGKVKGIEVLTYAKPDAIISKKDTYPVIFFIPGLGQERQDYTILCEELASHGYVVLSLDQPYVSNFVRFSDGSTIVLTLKDAWNIPRNRDYRYKYYDKAISAAIDDISFMLDHFDEINSNIFDRRLNPSKIILMGHSFGGNVANILGLKDDRIKIVVDIDSKITERKIYGILGVPSNPQSKPILFMRGMMQYQENLNDQLTKIVNADIWQPIVQHSAFADKAYLARAIPSIQKISIFEQIWSWFFKLGPPINAIDTDLSDQNVDQWFNEYRSRIVNWLDEKVKM